MSDTDDKANLTISPVRSSLQTQLQASGATPERAAERTDQKIDQSKKWWTFAVIALAIALGFLVVGFKVVIKIAIATQSVPLVLAIALGVPPTVFVGVAVYCASEADPEATRTFFQEILAFRKRRDG